MFQLVRARPRLFVVLGAVLALALVSATTVFAYATPAGKTQKVKAVTDDGYTFVTGLTWTDIDKMAVTLNVPKGQAVFLITFSGDTHCQTTDGYSGVCQLRVMVNGQAFMANPSDSIFAWAPADGSTSFGSYSMQFFTSPLPAGSYEFKMQFRGGSPNTTFAMQIAKTMTVLRAKV